MHTKNSAGDNSSVNKVFGPIAGSAHSDFSSNYFGNVAKAYSKWYNAPGDGKNSKEAGQFWGSVLQNRTYDSKGNLNKKTNKGK